MNFIIIVKVMFYIECNIRYNRNDIFYNYNYTMEGE